MLEQVDGRPALAREARLLSKCKQDVHEQLHPFGVAACWRRQPDFSS
jgi:hypothetical protein